MLAHTFAGTTLRSMLGLEDEAAVFARFRATRRAERHAMRIDTGDMMPARGADQAA